MQATVEAKIGKTQTKSNSIFRIKSVFLRRKIKRQERKTLTGEEYLAEYLKAKKQLDEGRGTVHEIIEA